MIMKTLLAAASAALVLSSPVSAETFLKGAKPFRIPPCATWRYADPVPLPETVHPGLDNRPECARKVIVKTKKVSKTASRKVLPTVVPVPIK